MTKQKYDVVDYGHHLGIELHFCREWDEDGGCYGTNLDHGWTFEEAKQQVSMWYYDKHQEWEQMTEEKFLERYS